MKKLINDLSLVIAADRLLVGDMISSVYYSDVFYEVKDVNVVVMVASAEEVELVVKCCIRYKIGILSRGAGLSYTGGVVAEGLVVLDMSLMDKVLSVDVENGVVVVEAGCSWKHLLGELSVHGVKTRFWGTLSGIHATVGGSLSQHSLFWGSARYGCSAESVLGLEVVSGLGEKLNVGCLGNGSAAFRWFGVDSCGLFLGDCGAFGVKTKVALRLVSDSLYTDGVSFEFKHRSSFLKALQAVANSGIGTEVVGFDPLLQQARLKRESLVSDLKVVSEVAKHEKSILRSLWSLLTFAFYGRRKFSPDCYQLHVLSEQYSRASLKEDIKQLHSLAYAHGGNKLPTIIPKALRANPFSPLNNMLGPQGERWLPIHGIVAHGDAEIVCSELADLFVMHASEMQKYKVTYSILFSALGSQGAVIEPVFYWEDELYAIHAKYIDTGYLSRLRKFPANPDGKLLVLHLKDKIIAIFTKYHAVHFQIGRSYPYLVKLAPSNAKLVRDIKNILDPHNVMNPGVLGL
ncbi:MAG: FAD-binding oxidoreductase [Methylacidiphilales bacterium]|nr:FAD-binding oxidoreductase [Candidatus Methylacidiphilales bacterium]